MELFTRFAVVWLICVSISLAEENFVYLKASATTTSSNVASVGQRQSELKTRSVLSSSSNDVELNLIAKQITEPMIDDQILDRIVVAIHSERMTGKCSIALNKTIYGIRMRQSWAIASKFYLLSCFEFTIIYENVFKYTTGDIFISPHSLFSQFFIF